ncbi:YraN family protein [Acetobacteraceae bacterium KSS8]|uniref:UPF0102 protein NFI95_00305 n=1 Tax=Endosaccharibacter trunci TaxID=2812733 RepID=A0ABT1W1Z4_9PROT|nr:YraN family protein [Acetobacteraceae bacterium KSS8]
MPAPSLCRHIDQRSGPVQLSPPLPALRTERGAVNFSRGISAEQRAAEALRADGWEILAQRARTPAGEIDLVARSGGLLAFVEVKARPTLADAAHCLSERQQRRLEGAAALLLAAHPDWMRDGIRFDMMLVDRDGAVRRIRDAFRLGEGSQLS